MLLPKHKESESGQKLAFWGLTARGCFAIFNLKFAVPA